MHAETGPVIGNTLTVCPFVCIVMQHKRWSLQVERCGLVTVSIVDDFDLARIAESGQCFRWTMQVDGSWRIIHAGQCLHIRKEGEWLYSVDCTAEEFEKIWCPYFDLDTSYSDIRKLIDAESDPFLAKAAEAERGIRILRQDPWDMVISFLISQNRSIPMIRHSIEALCEEAGEVRTDRQGQKYRTFPTPAGLSRLSEETLRGVCRLGYRWRYIQAVSRQVDEGSLDLSGMSGQQDDEIRQALLQILGVGEKVACCIMLFGFHRLNTFPVDVWMKRVIENEYPDGYDCSAHQPYNGVYQQYMFAYYRNQSGRT